MPVQSYTLVLTHGAHTISPAAAAVIRQAIIDGARLVDVQMEFFGDVDARSKTTIVTAHVMALAEDRISLEETEQNGDSKVHRLRIRDVSRPSAATDRR